MTMPNFLIIGAQKSGTTSLYFGLNQHPEIFMSRIKEPHFFSFFAQPEKARRENFRKSIVLNKAKYEALFRLATNEIAIGEASPSYLFSRTAPLLIRDLIPDARLIGILRNPVERAFSNFLHCVRNGMESEPDFSKVIELETKRIMENYVDEYYYIQKGYYFKQLQQYSYFLQKSHLGIWLFEDLRDNPRQLFKEIFTYLQVNPNFIPEKALEYTTSRIPKSKLIGKTIHTLRKNMFCRFLIKNALPSKFTKTLRSQVYIQPKVDDDVRKKLQTMYRDDILQLQDLVRRDLSTWLE